MTGGGYAGAEFYSYDAEGNRETSHLAPSYTHDQANRLRSDEDTCYDYDANGNLTSKRVKVGLDCVTDLSGATTTYEWDVLNRLVRIDNPDDSYAAYRYDAQGRRIEKDVNGALTRYIYDGAAILLEYDGANALLATYSHGEQVDQPLAMTRGGESFFYHTDHLGSVRLVTDGAGTVTNRYDYDAFGNWEEATSYETVANPFGFTARERDAESGLMFYRARYYDPEIGRFISEDPIGFDAGDLNLYRYVGNSPVMLVDPSGNLGQISNAVLAQFAVGVAHSMISFAINWQVFKYAKAESGSSAACAALVTAATVGAAAALATGFGFGSVIALVTAHVAFVAILTPGMTIGIGGCVVSFG